MAQGDCRFCEIAQNPALAQLLYEDQSSLAFLDHRPLFAGHSLVVPRKHVETLADLPSDLIAPFFKTVQLLARAIERGLQADGVFVANNNRVSQSEPHLHFHVIPRRRKDGMKGFFWPRHPYKDEQEAQRVQAAIRAAIAELQPGS